jgi:hypothetical protein
MVFTLSDSEIMQMKAALMDRDAEEAFRLLKKFIKRMEQQKNSGMKGAGLCLHFFI